MISTQTRKKVHYSASQRKDGESIEELFFQWKLKNAQLEKCPDEQEDKLFDQLCALEGRILKIKPETLKDFAIQFLTCTANGCVPPDSFFDRAILISMH